MGGLYGRVSLERFQELVGADGGAVFWPDCKCSARAGAILRILGLPPDGASPAIDGYAVLQRLSRSGLKVLQIRPNRGVFLVDARDQSARLIRLVVDARDGAILQRYAMADPRGGLSDGGAFAPAPGFAPPVPGEGSPSLAKPRPAAPRAKPAPSEATVAPAREQVPKIAPPPVAVAAPPPAPIIGPGYANGVPINPLD